MTNPTISPVIAMQLALLALLFITPIVHAAIDTGLQCSLKCWRQQTAKERCSNADTNVEHDCMCGQSIIPYYAFTLCNEDCKKTKGGLPTYMQCPPIFDDNGRPVKLPQETIYADLSNGIRDLSNVHPPFKPHRHGPGQIPPTASVAATPVPVTISGHVWSDNLPPTTFVTATVRAAKDEKGVAPDDFDSSEVLTAMAEEDVASVVDKHKKTTQTTSTYIFTPHVTGSAFIGWCGAPGTSCNEKDIVPDDYDSSNVITTASNSEKTLNATAVPSPTANSTLALATSAPALKHAATSSSTTIPWAATTLASYASNSWDGAPPDTLATYAGNTWAGQPPPPKRDGSVFPTGSVSPSGDCELPGYCAEELSEES